MRGERFFVRASNCWRVEQADRFAFIVDAADYFRAAKDVMLKAKRAIYLIGWDFDTRIRLEPGEKTLEGPDKLGPFLRWLDRTRPDLRIYVLKWDIGALQSVMRGMTPMFITNFRTSSRFHFKLDSAHPAGSAHHQKIVVVDDVIAFCGGLDMTANRWDTRRHLDVDMRRIGHRGVPWHDSTTAVDGDVARAIGEIARQRWWRATGQRLEPPGPCEPLWPQHIDPHFRDIEVAVARTMPAYGEQEEVREIERLYLDAIAAARRTIYCETQYFASDRIAEAIAARLREPDGPEVVIVNPEHAEGIIGSEVMDTRRSRLLETLLPDDRNGRFRIYHPVTEQDLPIYVHSKVLVVDDRLLRIGSSNLNNRSMGFDTECDLAVAADEDDREIRTTITQLRNDLLGEHLGLDKTAVAEAIEAAGGSLIATLDRLTKERAGTKLRSLHPIKVRRNGFFDKWVSETLILDPDRPPMPFSGIRRALKRLLP